MLLLEQQGDDEREVIDSLQQAVIRWQRRRRLAFAFHQALAPDDYDAFRKEYNEYWRTYFDPIAIRVQVSPQRYRLETVVLPV